MNWYLLACSSLIRANLSGPGLHKTASSVALYRIIFVWLYCVVFDDCEEIVDHHSYKYTQFKQL